MKQIPLPKLASIKLADFASMILLDGKHLRPLAYQAIEDLMNYDALQDYLDPAFFLKSLNKLLQGISYWRGDLAFEARRELKQAIAWVKEQPLFILEQENV